MSTRIVLCLMALALLGCQHEVQPAKRLSVPAPRRDTDISIHSGPLSESERSKLIKLAASGNPGEGVGAMTRLLIAVQEHYFPADQFKQIVEKSTIAAEPLWAWNYAFFYLHPDMHRGAPMYMPSADYRDKTGLAASSLSEEDKTFCKNTLANPSEGTQIAVGGVVASKRHLKAVDRDWLIGILDEKIVSPSAGDVARDYWRFLRRVVVARNP